MGVSPERRQDRGQPAGALSRSGGRRLDYESVIASAVGPSGIYLFELGAQPGGPEGRSHTTAGSKPIAVVERPRSVPALRSCLVVLVVGTASWCQSGGTSSRTR